MRRIGIFTGNRAEYGLLKPIIKAIEEHPGLDYFLIVSGAHVDSDFGKTIQEIELDGFTISAIASCEKFPDGKSFTALSIASTINAMSYILESNIIDVMLVYADRFEGFAALVAATQMNIPTAHVEGGDLTEGGALDDSIRHAMTKLAHLHFATNQDSCNRILSLGEEDWRVFDVGFPAIDLILEGDFATDEELFRELSLDTQKPIVLFTQHSISTEPDKSRDQLLPSLKVLRKLALDGIQIVLTYPNNDSGSHAILDLIKEIKAEEIQNFRIINSLGRYRYHGILSLALNAERRVVCVGNSSSGIKETPAFLCPTVNIGSRQLGRLRGENVIDVDYSENAIEEAIKLALYDDEFRSKVRLTSNPYFKGGASKLIAETLAKIELGDKILRKRMTN